jgi:type IV secretion system protein VirD4
VIGPSGGGTSAGQPPAGGFEAAFAALLGAATAVAMTVFGGAWLAAALAGGDVSGGVAETFRAAGGLVSAPGEPAAAWGQYGSGLPGPGLYWASTGAVAAVVVSVCVGAVVLWRRWAGPKRVRFGVDGEARQARRGDVAPLKVPSTVPPTGRLLLGRMAPRGPLLATEDRERYPMRRRARQRQGSRGSVALIGPTQSGKTTLLVGGLLTWDGPVIALSVKRDLYDITAGGRAERGEIAVFDPGGSTGMASARWTPLRGVATASGAMRAGRSLAGAIPRSGVTNGDYWTQQGQMFISAYMALAGLSELTVARGEGPLDAPLGIGQLKAWAFSQVGIKDEVVGKLVRVGLSADDLEMNLLAQEAAQTLLALDKGDARIRDSIYATARTAFAAWGEPSVAHSASLDPRLSYRATERWDHVPRHVDLDWLMSGDDDQANTLYLVAPDTEFERLAPVLGGLLGDFREQIHAWDVEGRRLEKPLLIVIDEAAQLELTWLPQEVSTIAGLGGLIVTCWQSKAQIDHKFGTLADAVLGGHRSKVVFAGCDDPATLNWLRQVAGTEHVARRGWSADVGSGGRRTVSENVQSEDLVSPHVARQMLPGDGVLIHGTLPPVHLRSVRWWDDSKLSALARKGPDGRPVVPDAVTCPLSSDRTEAERPPATIQRVPAPEEKHSGSPREGRPQTERPAAVRTTERLPAPTKDPGNASSDVDRSSAAPTGTRSAALTLVKDPPADSAPSTPDEVDQRRDTTPSRRRSAAASAEQLTLLKRAAGDLAETPADGEATRNRYAGRCESCSRWLLPGQGVERTYGKRDVVVCMPACPETGGTK